MAESAPCGGRATRIGQHAVVLSGALGAGTESLRSTAGGASCSRPPRAWLHAHIREATQHVHRGSRMAIARPRGVVSEETCDACPLAHATQVWSALLSARRARARPGAGRLTREPAAPTAAPHLPGTS